MDAKVQGAGWSRSIPAVRAHDRKDVFLRPLLPGEDRSREQIVEHYRVERELAERLRVSDVEDRQRLYREVYDELFARLPHHPQLQRKATPDETRLELDRQWSFLRQHIRAGDIVAEIGAGDGALSMRLARHCRHVKAIDVSPAIGNRDDWPSNCEFVLTNGTVLPLESASVDVVYSNQLMEHLHPDDAAAQLREIARVLRPGGRYICVTPNRIAGPWDVSVYFDEAARGLHLREYCVGELANLLSRTGFGDLHVHAGGRGLFFRVPASLVQAAEGLLLQLPYRLRSRISRLFPVRALLGLRVVAWKPQDASTPA